MRKKIVAGNWKMNLSHAEAIALATELKEQSDNFPCEVIVFPSYIYLSDVLKTLEVSVIRVGAQNCSDQPNGALTGEVSAQQLADLKTEFVLIGHSERRQYLGEHEAQLAAKLKIAVANGLIPVFCCGEPLQEREKGTYLSYVQKQLEESFFALSREEATNAIIAYEPVWAIGTGVHAEPAQAQEMHAFIRGLVKSRYDEALASEIRILYGGSCKPSNAATLLAMPDVDGGLIGGASLHAKDFADIINAIV